MTGSPFARAATISCRMYSSATQLSSPQEVRHRLTDSRMGSGRSPQNAQLTSMTSSAGRLPNPARAPNPPAANTALSRSVRNLSQIRSLIDVTPSLRIAAGIEPGEDQHRTETHQSDTYARAGVGHAAQGETHSHRREAHQAQDVHAEQHLPGQHENAPSVCGNASAGDRIVFQALVGILWLSRASRTTFIGSRPSSTRLICSRNSRR